MHLANHPTLRSQRRSPKNGRGAVQPIRQKSTLVRCLALVLLGVGLLLSAGCGGATEEDAVKTPDNETATTAAVEQKDAEATSLLGQPLLRAGLAEETKKDFEQKLAAAQADLEATPDSPEALIWVGRRTAYLGRYQDAIDIFSEGVERFPEDPRFLRHRGHRYLSTRQLDKAVDDFSRAYQMIQGKDDVVEPDGMPNAQGTPTSTLHSNIRYHLALVHYLQGDFDKALPLYVEDVEKAGNPDMRIASTYWNYLTLRRLGRDAEAAEILESVDADMTIIENHDYHRLLLYFKGELDQAALLGQDSDGPDQLRLRNATVGYGVATFDLVEGREQQAFERYRAILEEPQWASFGYIAAEAEVARASEE